jgi:hypothetical protein
MINQKGIALYLSLVTMSIFMAAAFGLSAIFLGQTKAIGQIGDSAVALSAADAGIEKILLNKNHPQDIAPFYLSNGASYQVSVVDGGTGACPVSAHYCIKSIGTYLEARRAIEIIY